MARWERRIEIEASPARVWSVMADVARWPEWTPSIESVEEVSRDFGLGGTAMVKAKVAPPSKYTVTRWEPGRGFDWETKVRGARSIGGHWIEPNGEGQSRVTLSLEVKGVAGFLGRPFIGKGITESLRQECEGLKRASEAH